MQNETRVTRASEDYSAAYAVHYGAKSVGEAFGLYRRILVAYPDTEEAKCSRAQIQNIMKTVVPEGELFDLQVDLAAASFEREPRSADPANPGNSAVSAPIASEIPS